MTLRIEYDAEHREKDVCHKDEHLEVPNTRLSNPLFSIEVVLMNKSDFVELRFPRQIILVFFLQTLQPPEPFGSFAPFKQKRKKNHQHRKNHM